jgi:hypothetical protein
MNAVEIEKWTSTSARDELDAVVQTLGADEVRVLVRIAERLQHGRKVYGALDVERDGRDFRREAREEIEDALVYSACLWLKEEATR